MARGSEQIRTMIGAFLAKAEKTNNQHERDAFMMKVNELLERHQLEMWEVRAEADPMGETVGEARISDTMSWGRDLVWAVSRYYYCETLFFGWNIKTPTKRDYRVIGRESCRVTTELMLPFIISQIRQRARDMVREGTAHSKDRAERYIANALISRIYRLIDERKTSANEFAGKGLVLVDEARAAMNELHPDAKTVKMRDLVASAAAKEQAEKVSLHHQATAGAQKRLGNGG